MWIRTWPDTETLQQLKEVTPSYMFPNDVPIAVFAEEILSKDECVKIAYSLDSLVPYNHEGCDAKNTREVQHVPMLEDMRQIALMLNRTYFGFDVHETPTSWMQTYEVGNYYQKHMDQRPGSSRKFTAVLMLSDPADYAGGELWLEYQPQRYQVKPTQGTIAIFPAWLLHTVSPVSWGARQTINMGFFGPPFR